MYVYVRVCVCVCESNEWHFHLGGGEQFSILQLYIVCLCHVMMRHIAVI